MTRDATRGDGLAVRVRTHVAEERLLERSDTVVVAVSGGLDSMVLLHLLRFALPDLALELVAAHVDHAMRPSSAPDALWVRGVCRAWGIPCRVTALDPPARSEADARDRRYAFLEEVSAAADADVIVTGHHLDDQAETVLFRAIRGTGIRGLRGIAPRRGHVLRPLLPFRRAELRSYAERARLRYREDPTNTDLSIARNRIRHEVIPALEAARPGAALSLARLADRARAAERSWTAAVERLEREVVVESTSDGVVLARPVLRSYHPALRVHVVRHLLRRFGSTPDRAGTHAALEFISSGPSGGEIHLPGGVRLERDFDRIRIVADLDGAVRDGVGGERPLTVPDEGPGAGRARVGGRWVDVVWGGAVAEPPSHRSVLTDPAFPYTVRGWRPGDRMRFHYGRKKLKELFREHRLDRRARRSVPVVEDGEGGIVWVVGIARAEGVGVDGGGFQIAVRNAGQH